MGAALCTTLVVCTFANNLGAPIPDWPHGLPPVALGNNHTCVLSTEGEVRCFGRNDVGQLGLGHTDDVGLGESDLESSASIVDLGTNEETGEPLKAVAIAAGRDFTCALLEPFFWLKCWGDNAYGKLGLGEGDTDPRGVSPGQMGDNLPYVPLSRRLSTFAVGGDHVCVVSDDQRGVYCWGRNDFGQRGVGNTETVGSQLEDMQTLDSVQYESFGQKVITLSLGEFHSCILVSEEGFRPGHQRTICFGSNSDGQLGLPLQDEAIGNLPEHFGSLQPFSNSELHQSVPTQLMQRVWTGAFHTCLHFQPDLVCVGNNEYRQLGNGVSLDVVPIENYPPDSFIDVGVGNSVKNITFGHGSLGYHTCVVFEGTNRVRCFGNNEFGQLGIGSQSEDVNENSLPDLPWVALGTEEEKQVFAVMVGGAHTCILLNTAAVQSESEQNNNLNLRLKCFGDNRFGQLGYSESESESANSSYVTPGPFLEFGLSFRIQFPLSAQDKTLSVFDSVAVLILSLIIFASVFAFIVTLTNLRSIKKALRETADVDYSKLPELKIKKAPSTGRTGG